MANINQTSPAGLAREALADHAQLRYKLNLYCSRSLGCHFYTCSQHLAPKSINANLRCHPVPANKTLVNSVSTYHLLCCCFRNDLEGARLITTTEAQEDFLYFYLFHSNCLTPFQNCCFLTSRSIAVLKKLHRQTPILLPVSCFLKQMWQGMKSWCRARVGVFLKSKALLYQD